MNRNESVYGTEYFHTSILISFYHDVNRWNLKWKQKKTKNQKRIKIKLQQIVYYSQSRWLAAGTFIFIQFNLDWNVKKIHHHHHHHLVSTLTREPKLCLFNMNFTYFSLWQSFSHPETNTREHNSDKLHQTNLFCFISMFKFLEKFWLVAVSMWNVAIFNK